MPLAAWHLYIPGSNVPAGKPGIEQQWRKGFRRAEAEATKCATTKFVTWVYNANSATFC